MPDSVFGRVRKILFEPAAFFDEAKREEGMASAILDYAVLSFVFLTLALIAQRVFAGVLNLSVPAQDLVSFVFVLAGAWVFWNIFNFVVVAVVHSFVWLLGGRQGYAQTYKAMTYGATPYLLLGWIPVVGFLSFVWALYVQAKGIAALQLMSVGRALAAILIPVLIVTLLMAWYAYVWIAGLQGQFSGLQEPGNRTAAIGNNTAAEIRNRGTSARIDAIDAAGSVLYIRNMGTQILPTNLVIVSIDASPANCTWDAGTIPPGAVARCTFASDISNCGTIAITTPGTGDLKRC